MKNINEFIKYAKDHKGMKFDTMTFSYAFNTDKYQAREIICQLIDSGIVTMIGKNHKNRNVYKIN